LVVGAVVGGLVVSDGTVLTAQHPDEGMEWMVENLRPRNQAVIPIFEGWFRKPDGTSTFCFGYFSLNTEEVVEIPLGPDNFIEPTRFDGMQPTHFEPVPPPPHDYRRHFCSVPVNVPADFPKDQDVVWTLRHNGKALSVPGHMVSTAYALDEKYQESREVYAPLVRLEPSGPVTMGRDGVIAGPLTTGVGSALPLTVTVARPTDNPRAAAWPDPDTWYVRWAKHQGPGVVSFSEEDEPGGWLKVDRAKAGGTQASTSARFSAPGAYVLRVETLSEPGEGGHYQFECCWTTLYVRVSVAP
jgi:hypothetical protein